MDLAYEKSLLMIKTLGIRLTRKQYNILAVRFGLLSPTTLQFISKCSFNYIVKEMIKSSV